MPPHVTLIYPFADSELLAATRLRELAEVVSRSVAFTYRLVETARFTNAPPILYLVPEPAEPFCTLIGALAEAFPENPPYGGAHSEPIPHVTVADRRRHEARCDRIGGRGVATDFGAG